MKLISMTDYVIEQNKNIDESNHLVLSKIVDYALFLKQPLKLSMFVPCGENGNILEEPKVSDSIKIWLYEMAKEDVLFDGFSFDSGFVVSKRDCFNIKIFKDIEDLTVHNLELTQAAINKLK